MNKVNKKNRNKLLLSYIFSQKYLLIIGLFLLFIKVIMDMWSPQIIGEIIDTFFKKGNTHINVSVFYKKIGLFAAVTMINVFAAYFSRYIYTMASGKIIQSIREDAFAHLQKFPISYFDTLPVGKIVSRITNDSKNLQTLFENVLWQILSSLTIIIGVYAAIFKLDRKFMLYALIPVPIVALIIYIYRSKVVVYYNKVREARTGINSQVHENINGIKIIKAFGLEDKKSVEYEQYNGSWFKNNLKLIKLDAFASYNIVDFLSQLIHIGILFYFGYGSITGKYDVSVGTIYILINYSTLLFAQVNGIMQNTGNLENAIGAAEHIFELLLEPVPVDKSTDRLIPGDVEFSDVSFSYVKEEEVLRNISFTLKKGEKMAFVGSTGSGKSTIMNLLFRFYDPASGKILIGNKDISEVSRDELRSHMGIVLQEPYLFTGSIYSNISLDNESITKEDATEALIAVGASNLLKREGGIDAKVTEKGNTYSAGERQLISFARALAHNPSILILDEATSNIDSETEQKITHAMEVLSKNRTTLIIAHRLSTIRDANVINVLDKGHIVESGSHEELMKLKGEYYKIYEYQRESAM